MSAADDALDTGKSVVSGALSGAAVAGAAIGIGAALGTVIPGFGTAIGAAVGAIIAAGVAIGNLTKDTFHVPPSIAEAWLTLFRLDPALLFQGVDNTGSALQAQKLVRYFRIISGEVPKGKYGNTGELYNPNNNDCKNPYMCAGPDPDEPLTSNIIVPKLHDAYTKWVQAGASLPTFVKSVPSQVQDPAQTKILLDVIRQIPAPFTEALTWDAAKNNMPQIQEAIRAARARAGETGPDSVLTPLFGDVTPYPAPAPKDPKMAGGFSQGLGFGIGLLPGLLLGGSLLSLAAYYWPKKRP